MALVPQTYSFLNTYAHISGPGLSTSLGSGAGVAEEGLTIDAFNDKNTLTVGADGTGQNVLNAANNGTIVIRLLKTSPTNAILMDAYNAQKTGTANWGKNVITLADIVRGDSFTATGVAFKGRPAITWNKVGPMIEWTFDCVAIEGVIGNGTGGSH